MFISLSWEEGISSGVATSVWYSQVCVHRTDANLGHRAAPFQNAIKIRVNPRPLKACLMVGGSYTCVLTGRNARGEGSPTTVGPIVVKPPSGNGLARCTGNRGTMTIDPGMQQKAAQSHTLDLSATFTSCKGPYVSSARASFSLRTKRVASCGSAVGLSSSGPGTLFWTAPAVA